MKKNKSNKNTIPSNQDYQKIDDLLSVMPIKAKPIFMDKIINTYQKNLSSRKNSLSLMTNLKNIFLSLFPQKKRALSLAALGLVIFLGVMINVNVLHQQLDVNNYLFTSVFNNVEDNPLSTISFNNEEANFIENELPTIITGDYYQF